MSTLTPAQTTIVARVRKAATVTDRNALTIADGLVALAASGLSSRAIVAALAGTDYPLGRNRVALIIRTRKAHPDADAAAYGDALRAATAENSASAVTAADTDTAEQPLPVVKRDPLAVTAADAVAPVTLDTLTDRLADLFAAARDSLTPADLAAFLAAVDAETAYSAPVIVALPVAV